MSGKTEERLALVVDDVPVNRQLAAAFLARLGWSVADADDGKAALEWLGRNSAVDLVLLDIGMPGLNGEEVCRELRSNPHFAGLCVVAYTAHALPGDVERFLAAGFNAVLIKPISLQMVRDVIDGLFPR
ncbi:MAG: response regulator [Propionivibrio sp.]